MTVRFGGKETFLVIPLLVTRFHISPFSEGFRFIQIPSFDGASIMSRTMGKKSGNDTLLFKASLKPE